jgi:peptide/nickel transport system substrate-binding protein
VNTALANRGGFYYLPAWVSTAWVGFKDPAYDAIVDSIVTATTVEEQIRSVQEANMYIVKEHWSIWGPEVPMFQARQPWVKGYNGELWLGRQNSYPVFARVWIDQELKKAMGN